MLTNLLIKFSQSNELFHCKYPVKIFIIFPYVLLMGKILWKIKVMCLAGEERHYSEIW